MQVIKQVLSHMDRIIIGIFDIKILTDIIHQDITAFRFILFTKF